MAGNNSTVGLETVTFTDNMSFDGTERGGAMTTNGELWIGSTAPRHVQKGTIVSPNNSITFGYSSPNITAQVNTAVIQDLHTARFIVSAGGTTDGANYTSISSALSAAAATGTNQTIFIQPGTYTENLTLSPGINLSAYTCDSTTPNVIIVGTCTLTAAGTVSISGIRLQTNGSFAIAVTGSAASILNISDCYLNFTNNTGISFTSSNGSSSINVYNSIGNLGTTGIAIYSMTAIGNLLFYYCNITNSAGSTTASSNSAGTVAFTNCELFSPLASSSTAVLVLNGGFINTNSQNATCVTSSGTSQVSLHNLVSFASGSASSLSIGTGSQMTNFSVIEISSTNTNAITGLGTIAYGLIVYSGSSSTNNVSTQNALVTQPSLKGTVIKQVRATNSTASTIATTIASTATTPSTSVGGVIVSGTITPSSSSNIIVINGSINAFSNGYNNACLYLIVNNTGTATFVQPITAAAAQLGGAYAFQCYFTAGTTSSTTYAIWGAGVTAGMNINGPAGTSVYGGCVSTMLITEYTP